MFFQTLQTRLLTCFLIQIIPVQSQVSLTFVDPCPASWHHWGNSCYRVTETSFVGSKARDECHNLGGALVVPRTVQENTFIGALIPAGENAWIDCDDLDKIDIWVCREGDEEVPFRNRDIANDNPHIPVQPNDGTNQRCVVISRKWTSQHLWHDHFCSTPQRAACKKPAGPRFYRDK